MTETVSFLDLGFVIMSVRVRHVRYNLLQKARMTDVLFGIFNTGKDFLIPNRLILASRLFIEVVRYKLE